MQNIGRRYQQFFPSLLPSNYSREWYLFRNSWTRRSHASIRGFVDGLFGDGGFEDVEFEDIPAKDSFMRPIDFCPEFTFETSRLPEREAFGKGPEVEQMLDEVNNRLGFRGSNQLSFNTVWIMWEWCRFETASEFELSESPIGEASVWCAPFSIAHHAIFEYYADLGYYYFTGYGVRNQRLIENLNCGLMQDLLTHIQDDSADSQVSKVYVTQSQIVQAFLVILGAMRDEHHLHQHNFAQQSFRHWKTTFLTPNAGNLAIIRFE